MLITVCLYEITYLLISICALTYVRALNQKQKSEKYLNKSLLLHSINSLLEGRDNLLR